jgi:hypothetical protein
VLYSVWRSCPMASSHVGALRDFADISPASLFDCESEGHPGTNQLPIGVLNCQRDDVESNCSGERDRGEGKPHFPPLYVPPSAPS